MTAVRNLLVKELKLCASPLSFLFIPFGLMFFIPGYPILCGAFFITLGIFQSFQTLGETNDILFSALLPVDKRDVVKGKYLFVCLIELWGFMLMCVAALLRGTLLRDAAVYRQNAMMNANGFALGVALLIFALFNLLFVGGFFKTAYKIGKPFIIYILVSFGVIAVAEALHHFPSMKWLNGTQPLQLALLSSGVLLYVVITVLSCRKSCRRFEQTDL